MTMSVESAVSEMAEDSLSSLPWNNDSQKYEHVGEVQPKETVLRLVPWIFRFDRAPIEATGLSIDMFTRATVLMSSIFLGPALLELANDAVADECQHLDETSQAHQDCLDNGRIHGFKPSSLLSNIAVGGGILGALVLPICGAVVDRTPYRRQVGMYSAMFLTVVKLLEMMVGPNTWFAVAWLQVFTAVLFCIHVSAIYAYTSELSDDANVQTKYNSHYFVILYGSALLFMVETLGTALVLSTDSVGTAKIALSFTVVNTGIGFTFAWKHFFRDRPALTEVKDGSSIILSGFRSLCAMFGKIHRELPALRWLMLAIICGESGNASVVTIGTTYMVHYLQMDGKDVGIVFLALLLMGPLGAKVGEFIALRSNPVTGAKVCMGIFIVNTSVAAVTLTGPDRSQYTVIFGMFWGICLGWLYPLFTAAFVALRPSGMDAQMMGLYLFCGHGFTWLPPLLFTFFNEYGFHISWCLASLNVFYVLGILCLLAMGSYEKAVEATRSQTERLGGDDPVGEDKMGDNSLAPSNDDPAFEIAGHPIVELPVIT